MVGPAAGDLLDLLARRDLTHVLERILSWLDRPSLANLARASPAWAIAVRLSRTAYRQAYTHKYRYRIAIENRKSNLVLVSPACK